MGFLYIYDMELKSTDYARLIQYAAQKLHMVRLNKTQINKILFYVYGVYYAETNNLLFMNKIGRTKEIPRIIVPQGAQKHIASHFGVSGETVRGALKYIINTELAVRIREEAIKNYGGAESIIRVKI